MPQCEFKLNFAARATYAKQHWAEHIVEGSIEGDKEERVERREKEVERRHWVIYLHWSVCFLCLLRLQEIYLYSICWIYAIFRGSQKEREREGNFREVGRGSSEREWKVKRGGNIEASFACAGNGKFCFPWLRFVPLPVEFPWKQRHGCHCCCLPLLLCLCCCSACSIKQLIFSTNS